MICALPEQLDRDGREVGNDQMVWILMTKVFGEWLAFLVSWKESIPQARPYI